MRNVIDRLSGIAVIPLDNAALDADRAFYGINCTGELNKRPIAHQLDHTAAILGDGGMIKLARNSFSALSVPASSSAMRRV